jgi:hypothetical protein
MSNMKDVNGKIQIVRTDMDPYEQIADQGRDILKFQKGEWLVGDEVINGKRVITEVDRMAYGWRMWRDGRIVAEEIGFVNGNFRPKSREELGELDETKWPSGPSGEPTDPWQFVFLLRFRSDEGETFIWAASSYGAKKAAQRLAGAFSARGKRSLPIVELNVGSYRHPTYGKVLTPQFNIVGWTNDGELTNAKRLPVGPRSGSAEQANAAAPGPWDDGLPEIRG